MYVCMYVYIYIYIYTSLHLRINHSTRRFRLTNTCMTFHFRGKENRSLSGCVYSHTLHINYTHVYYISTLYIHTYTHTHTCILIQEGFSTQEKYESLKLLPLRGGSYQHLHAPWRMGSSAHYACGQNQNRHYWEMSRMLSRGQKKTNSKWRTSVSDRTGGGRYV